MRRIVKPERALLSVSDKSSLIALGEFLANQKIEILSTGGSARILGEAGIEVKEVADHTGFPEMMDGRVKTLHPKIHGGILALRENADHQTAMRQNEILPIDLVVINLYPFEETLAGGAGPHEIIENIDIGGPAMIRSAAKNYGDVVVIVDPADYPALMEEMNANRGSTTLAFRSVMAGKAFARTAAYDAAIANWLQSEETGLPERIFFCGNKAQELRYGENPHQTASFYINRGEKRPGVATAVQLQGKALSYNNLNDTDAAFELVSEFGETRAAVAIIKHANPCGVATAGSQRQAYEKALACDPVSAFGGIIALNQPLEAETAEMISKVFTEVIIAPAISDDAIEILSRKKNLRLLSSCGLADPAASGLRAGVTKLGQHLVPHLLHAETGPRGEWVGGRVRGAVEEISSGSGGPGAGNPLHRAAAHEDPPLLRP
ncbi:MAG: bifunctional phosphoribosylaminoimidazolecarboxamide formyltransferase/IMP cyclohydrolase [Bacteroidetes bacterium]|nr:bifunctional phosphoribosylaminoimidazolecarboxamide formyltransferase/IMP cyclohydrolase [Bacteroidota bacterium]